MNEQLLLAAGLLLLIGLVHSWLGEIRVFARLRQRAADTGALLPQSHYSILWASWHLVSLLGAGMAALLAWLALAEHAVPKAFELTLIIAGSLCASALLVFCATRGRHPGWAGLLLVGLLVGLSELR